MAVGMNDHFARPIDIGCLLTTMAKWIDSPGGSESRGVEPKGDRGAA